MRFRKDVRCQHHVIFPAVYIMIALCVSACGTRSRSASDDSQISSPSAQKRPRIAVSLSGGGYRASLNGLAALRALHDLDLLDDVEVVSGVSGGSITSAYYIYARSRDRDSFSFERFETELLEAIANYEIPRTLLAGELVTGANWAAGTLLDCIKRHSSTLMRGFGALKEAVAQCAGETNMAFGEASLWNATTQFAGSECNGAESLDVCSQENAESLTATLTTAGMAALLGQDTREDVQHMYCYLRRFMCTGENGWMPAEPENGTGRPAVDHLFADLLHFALFKPLDDTPGVVYMADLTPSPVLILNAASYERGELWTADTRGAGLHCANRTCDANWRPYKASRGPALASAVAASTCHPLFCSPIAIPWPESDGPALIDGGVHDNLGVAGLEAFLKSSGGQPIDLLLIADAARPYSEDSSPPSRMGIAFRIHDMLIAQRSQATLVHTQETFGGRCGVVRVHFESTGSGSDPLGTLPTDLRPVGEKTDRLLATAAQRFERRLRTNICIQQLAPQET